MARRYPVRCHSAERPCVCQFPVGVTAPRQTMTDAEMSIRCQISLCDEVLWVAIDKAGTEKISDYSSFAGQWHKMMWTFWRTSSTAMPRVLPWIHTFFMNSLLKSLIMLIKEILGPTFLYSILGTVQETLFKKALHWITSSHSNALFY